MDADATTSRQRVLVVDDEDYICDLLATSLRFQGFEVDSASCGFDALSSINRNKPDLVLLDVMLPDIDGFEVCRRLRDHGNQTPVIFLTARDAKEDMLSGFTEGGDDYVAKPFSLDEIIARMHAVLRRTAPLDDDTPLRYHDLAMDERAHRTTRHGEPIELSPTEWRLLRYLVINAERVVSKRQILDHVWHDGFGGDASSVETYISYLRKKIDAVEPRLIHTVRGIGYTMRIDP